MIKFRKNGKLKLKKAIDKYYEQEQIKKDTIEDVILNNPILSKDVSKELLLELYNEAFNDGFIKCQQDILDEYIEKQGCEKCKHYKNSMLNNYCELNECKFEGC